MIWIKEHKLLASSIIIISICLGIVGVILVDMIDENTVSSSKIVENDEASKKVNEETNTPDEGKIVTENPFGNSKTELSEKDVLNYMHGMSHQKVIAEEKWVHYEMTDERILYLISVIEDGSYKNEDTYLGILNKWASGDFSEADKDHNAIWRLQGGTIGEATGVMSTEQEKAYLEENEGNIQ